jgi:hypothetical protein
VTRTPSGGAVTIAEGEQASVAPVQPRLILEFLGAAAGIAAFVTLVGGALLWLRFDELGLPADRAVALLPRELLVTIGAHALFVPAIVGLGAVIAIYALEPWATYVLDAVAFSIVLIGVLVLAHLAIENFGGTRLTLAIIVALAAAAVTTSIVHGASEHLLAAARPIVVTFCTMGIAGLALAALALRLPAWPHLLIIVLVTLAGAAAVLGTANYRVRGSDKAARRPIMWIVFLSFLFVGAAVSLARTAAEPKMEPVALLLKDPDESIVGFYVGESDGRIHVAQLRHGSGLAAVSAEPVESIMSVSQDRVARMALRSPAGLGPEAEGREQAETLLEDLIAGRREATGEQPPPADPIVTDDPIRTFAPLASIHSREPVAPTTVDYFLNSARLFWSFRGCPAKALIGKLATREQWMQLGTMSKLEQAARCDGGGTKYSPSAYTRPYGDHRPGLQGREGFYLDLDKDKRKPRVAATGSPQKILTGVPVYYECHLEVGAGDRVCPPANDPGERDERITYWFFYPYSIPPKGTKEISHEGDWERISVLVHRLKDGLWTPKSVRYHEHDGHVDVPWADVRKAPDETGVATHPRAYVAKGSHANYRRAGKFVQVLALGGFEIVRVKDDARACPSCPLWFTWQRLVDATGEPWYGFGGAWGQVGDSSEFTGPLGPSKYKTLGRSASPETTLQQASEELPPSSEQTP